MMLLMCLMLTTGVLAQDPPHVQIISGAFIHEMPHLTPYTGNIPMFYKMKINSPIVHHIDALMLHECDEEEAQSEYETTACKIYDFTLAQLQSIDKKLSAYEEYLALVATHSHTIFGSNITLPDVTLPEDLPERSPLIMDLTERLGLTPTSTEIPSNSAVIDSDEIPLKRNRRNVISNAIGEWFSFCCGLVAQDDFDSLISNEGAVEGYMDQVTKQLTNEHQDLVKIEKHQEETDSYLNSTFHSLKKELDVIVLEDVKEAGRIYRLTSRFTRFGMLVANIAQFMNWFQDTTRHADIMDHCRNRLIPFDVVSIKTLTWDLLKIQTKLKKDGYGLAYPLSQISDYYTSPIADCTFTNQQIIVKISVPIVLLPSPKLFKIQPTPFLWNGSICSIKIQPTIVAVSDSGVTPITGLDLSACSNGKLCPLPQFPTDLASNALCPQKLFMTSTIQDLNNACKFECQAATRTHISKVGLNTYVLANLPEDAKIKCADKEIPLPIHNVGALQVKLPCSCGIHIPGHDILKPTYPCPNVTTDVEFLHVLPAAWTTLKSAYVSIQTQHETPKYEQLLGLLNETWTDIPSSNISLHDQILASIRPPKLFHYAASSFVPSLIIIWNIVLTLAVAWLAYKTIQRTYAPILAAAPVQYVRGLPSYESELDSIEMTMIVMLLFNLLIVIGVVIFLFCLICKNRKSNARTQCNLNRIPGDYREEDMVYNLKDDYTKETVSDMEDAEVPPTKETPLTTSKDVGTDSMMTMTIIKPPRTSRGVGSSNSSIPQTTQL